MFLEAQRRRRANYLPLPSSRVTFSLCVTSLVLQSGAHHCASPLALSRAQLVLQDHAGYKPQLGREGTESVEGTEDDNDAAKRCALRRWCVTTKSDDACSMPSIRDESLKTGAQRCAQIRGDEQRSLRSLAR